MLAGMSSTAPDGSRTGWSWRRHALVWGGGAALLPVLLAVALLLGLQRTLVERLAPLAGGPFGLAAATLSVDRLDLRQAELSNIMLFPGLSADHAVAAYDLSRPLAPKLLSATVSGVQLHLILDESGLHFPDGSLPAARLAALAGSGPPAPPSAPRDGIAANARLAIAGGALLLETPSGPLAARVTGHVMLVDGRPQDLALALRDVTGYGARASLVATGQRKDDGTYVLDLTLDEQAGPAGPSNLALTGTLVLPEGDAAMTAKLAGTLALPEEPVIHLTADIARGSTVTAMLGGHWQAAPDAPLGRLPRRGDLTLSLAGRPDRPCGDQAGLALGLNGTLGDWAVGPGRVGAARLALTARAEICDEMIRVVPTAASEIALDDLRQAGEAATLDTLVIGLAPGREMVAGRRDLTRGRLTIGPLQATGRAGMPFVLTLDSLSAETGGAVPVMAALAGATLSLPAQGIVARGLDVGLRGALAAGGFSGRVTIDRGEIADIARDRRVAAVFALTGGADLADGGIRFAGHLAEPSGILALDITGRHDLATGKGEAHIALTPLQLDPKRARVTDLIPALAGKVTNLRGGLGGSVALNWRGSRWDGTAEVALDGLGATTPQVELSGMTGTLHLSGLNPPRSPPGQELVIRQVLVGLGVGPVTLRFALQRDGKLAVEHASWPFYGGEIRIDDALLDPAAGSNRMQVQVVGVELGAVAALSGYTGLVADGRLSGVVPVVIDANGPKVVDGHLSADQPGGKLQLHDPDLRGMVASDRPELDFIFDLLTDFHFNILSATVDGPLNGELKVGLQIAGRNPEIEGGHPVNFNLTVEGPLRAMAQSGASLYNLGDTIGQRIIGGRIKGNGH